MPLFILNVQLTDLVMPFWNWMCLQVIKSARVMKKAVGYLIPFMEKEREDMMSEASQELVSLSDAWEDVDKTKRRARSGAYFSVSPELLRGGCWRTPIVWKHLQPLFHKYKLHFICVVILWKMSIKLDMRSGWTLNFKLFWVYLLREEIEGGVNHIWMTSPCVEIYSNNDISL